MIADKGQNEWSSTLCISESYKIKQSQQKKQNNEKLEEGDVREV